VGGLIAVLLVVTLASALQLRELALAIAEFDAELATTASTAAFGLAILGLVVLIAGIFVVRTIRTSLIDRLGALEQAAIEIQQGDDARRVALTGHDELARIGQALNSVLDLRARSDAEMRGHNREVRAVLVALLRQWPQAAAVTGVDGEIIVSTLSSEAEQILRSLTPRVRAAAKILLSRGFVSASELSTIINTGEGHIAHVRALAMGDQRIVGWLAVFTEVPKAAQTLLDDENDEPDERAPSEDDAAPDPSVLNDLEGGGGQAQLPSETPPLDQAGGPG
jgi:nitrogen fixation/metabolism regulation signal transduction histidine kinase